MNIDSLCGKSITLIGYGISNRALLNYFMGRGIFPTVRSEGEADLPNGIRGIFGDGYLDVCEEIVFRSPSVHPDKIKGASCVYTDCDLFLCNTDAYKIGITGSDGKTTSATLISEILKADNRRVHLCGNVGVPLASVFPDFSAGDFVVCELSSFQLHRAKIPLDVALVTSVSENHLDYHRDMADYVGAKKNILKKAKRAVVNYDSPYREEFVSESLTYFSQGDLSSLACVSNARTHYVYIKDGFVFYDRKRLFPVGIIRLRGSHNVYNVLGAVGVLWGSVSLESIVSAVQKFEGVHHRNEEIATLEGVKFIDSSADTTPARTLTTLRSYYGKNTVAIMGGQGKRLDCSPLSETAKSIHAAVVMGANREEIANVMSAFTKVIAVNDIYEATKIAYSLAKPGGYVVLSPASTSFDMFNDYKDRARKFKDAILKISPTQ